MGLHFTVQCCAPTVSASHSAKITYFPPQKSNAGTLLPTLQLTCTTLPAKGLLRGTSLSLVITVWMSSVSRDKLKGQRTPHLWKDGEQRFTFCVTDSFPVRGAKHTPQNFQPGNICLPLRLYEVFKHWSLKQIKFWNSGKYWSALTEQWGFSLLILTEHTGSTILMQHTNSVTAVRVMKFNKAPETGTELASLKCKKKVYVNTDKTTLEIAFN